MPLQFPTEIVAKLCKAKSATAVETIQELWSGYGAIVRVALKYRDEQAASVVAKFVYPPDTTSHKYGWADDVSHRRKLDSYKNEWRWYQGPSQDCSVKCQLPSFIASTPDFGSSDAKSDWLLIMEDLDAAGFNLRRQSVNMEQVGACLQWLANFHAFFLVDAAKPGTVLPAMQHQLWPTGTYWHLQTRPHEWSAMKPGQLKDAASRIDEQLARARFQTLVHGDSKLANFCFSPTNEVAAVDFQYVGGGCGMKDVAYFVSSCFDEEECGRLEDELLETYFSFLKGALISKQFKSQTIDMIEQEWRRLYKYAWADFYRFLSGWSPGHWKIHGYSKQVTDEVLSELNRLS